MGAAMTRVREASDAGAAFRFGAENEVRAFSGPGGTGPNRTSRSRGRGLAEKPRPGGAWGTAEETEEEEKR